MLQRGPEQIRVHSETISDPFELVTKFGDVFREQRIEGTGIGGVSLKYERRLIFANAQCPSAKGKGSNAAPRQAALTLGRLVQTRHRRTKNASWRLMTEWDLIALP